MKVFKRVPAGRPSPVQPCLDEISGIFAGYFTNVDQWRDAMIGQNWRGSSPTARELDDFVLEQVKGDLTAAQTPLIGAGFVANPGYVADAEWFLAWWLGENNTLGTVPAAQVPPIRRLEANLDPASESFRDYTTLEWWRVPIRTRKSHITGPYVDYLCTDDYTLTLTTPVYLDNVNFIGVLGVDIYVKTIEKTLLSKLRLIGNPATLINSAGRVIVSTDAHLAAGSLLRLPGLTEFLRSGEAAASPPRSLQLESDHVVHDCGHTTLSLIVTETD